MWGDWWYVPNSIFGTFSSAICCTLVLFRVWVDTYCFSANELTVTIGGTRKNNMKQKTWWRKPDIFPVEHTSSLLSNLSLICWQNTGSMMARHSGNLNSFESTKSLMQIIFHWVKRPCGIFVIISTMVLLEKQSNVSIVAFVHHFINICTSI